MGLAGAINATVKIMYKIAQITLPRKHGTTDATMLGKDGKQQDRYVKWSLVTSLAIERWNMKTEEMKMTISSQPALDFHI